MQNHFTLIDFWCERHDLLWSHSNGNIFTCEDNTLFSHVKISSFCTKAHLVIHWCLYNKIIMITHTQSVLHHSPQEVGFPGYYPLVSLRIHHCNIWEPLQIRMTDSIALDHLDWDKYFVLILFFSYRKICNTQGLNFNKKKK